jgi:hypothetical protein
MIASMARRVRLLVRYRRWAPVNPPYGRRIHDEGTPEVEAKILALEHRFGQMSAAEIGRYLNTSSLPLIASARDLGRS